MSTDREARNCDCGKRCSEGHDLSFRRLDLIEAFLRHTFDENYVKFLWDNVKKADWQCCLNQVSSGTWPFLWKLMKTYELHPRAAGEKRKRAQEDQEAPQSSQSSDPSEDSRPNKRCQPTIDKQSVANDQDNNIQTSPNESVPEIMIDLDSNKPENFSDAEVSDEETPEEDISEGEDGEYTSEERISGEDTSQKETSEEEKSEGRISEEGTNQVQPRVGFTQYEQQATMENGNHEGPEIHNGNNSGKWAKKKLYPEPYGLRWDFGQPSNMRRTARKSTGGIPRYPSLPNEDQGRNLETTAASQTPNSCGGAEIAESQTGAGGAGQLETQASSSAIVESAMVHANGPRRSDRNSQGRKFWCYKCQKGFPGEEVIELHKAYHHEAYF